ncbi:MAG: DUF3418 domain-containing protein, partial [Gammaproteobacteria bacterium]|nr:DUF3418 domain-containing protein [Gammaproteobacteria bacterium]
AQARGLLGLFERAHALRATLARVPAAVRADLEAQLAFLLGPAGVDYLDEAGLRRAGRALDAIERRLERVESNPGKDLRKLELVEPYARRFRELYAAGEDLSPALRGVQLMLEDFRISVFAPELGAASRVSTSDLEAQFALLEAPRG